MTTTENKAPREDGSSEHSLLVHALTQQALDLYAVDFTPAADDQSEWTLSHRFRLTEWLELVGRIDDGQTRFTFSSGHPQIKGSLGLLTWVSVHEAKSDDSSEAWLIAHPSLRLLLTAPDAEWFEQVNC